MILSKGQGYSNAPIIPPKDISKLPLFRLKHLSFNQEMPCLPLNIDPESLERLDLRLPERFFVLNADDLLKFVNIKHLCLIDAIQVEFLDAL